MERHEEERLMTQGLRSNRSIPHPWRGPALLGLLIVAVVAPTVLAKEVKVTIGARYAPAEVKVKAGDTVVWVNAGEKDHTVTADDGSFDSGNLPDGKTFRHTFKKPGKYKYHCEYHPRDKAVVVVE